MEVLWDNRHQPHTSLLWKLGCHGNQSATSIAYLSYLVYGNVAVSMAMRYGLMPIVPKNLDAAGVTKELQGKMHLTQTQTQSFRLIDSLDSQKRSTRSQGVLFWYEPTIISLHFLINLIRRKYFRIQMNLA